MIYVNLSDQMQLRDGITAPVSYWSASRAKVERNCNGCGTGGWLGALVPSTFYLLDMSEACDVHDWMYGEGRSDADKMIADLMFLENLIALIQQARKRRAGWDWTGAPKVLQLLRERRAFSYYQAVRHSPRGAAAFKKARLL